MWKVSICLQDEALVLLATALLRQKRGAGSVLKHLADTLVGLCRTLKVLVGTDLLADLLTLLCVSFYCGIHCQADGVASRCYVPALE